jgi:hypothetical protein
MWRAVDRVKSVMCRKILSESTVECRSSSHHDDGSDGALHKAGRD